MSFFSHKIYENQTPNVLDGRVLVIGKLNKIHNTKIPEFIMCGYRDTAEHSEFTGEYYLFINGGVYRELASVEPMFSENLIYESGDIDVKVSQDIIQYIKIDNIMIVNDKQFIIFKQKNNEILFSKNIESLLRSVVE